MLLDLGRAKPKSLNRTPRSSSGRLVFLTLIVILSLGSAKPNVAARAAAPADPENDNWDISISPIPSPACAHSHYELKYFARVIRVAEVNGTQQNLEGGLGPANVSVRATSSDPSIAEFNPETATGSGLDGLIAVSGTAFNLNTAEPGSATLTLTGRADWAGFQVKFPPLQQSITVVNCKFKISISGTSMGTIPNILETATYTLKGEIGGDANAALKGTAEVAWQTQGVIVCFSSNQTTSPSSATLEGSLSPDGDTLTLKVNFGPAMMFHAVLASCGKGAGSAPIQFQPAPITLTVPTTGGTRSRPVSMTMGDVHLKGVATINVVPIDSK